MRQLRRRSDVSKEFNDIYRALTSDARLGEGCSDILLHSASIRVRLLLSVVVQLMQQLVGIQIITVFGYDVLNSIGVHSILLGLFLSMLAGLLGAAMAWQNLDKMGRRFLLLVGSAAMALSWLGAAVCAYYGGLEHGKAELYFSSYLLRFLFGAFLCLFSFSYSFSLGPVAWVLTAEIFPFRARAKASAITVAVHYLAAIIGSQLLDVLLRSGYTTASSLLGFSAACLLFGLFVYLSIPETNGESDECMVLPQHVLMCGSLFRPGVMLEDMEELFALDAAAGCLPDLRAGSAGLLGFRRLGALQHQKQAKGAAGHAGAGHHTPGGGGSSDSILTPNTHRSYSALGDSSAQQVLFEPSSLHKYSTDLRENQFSYYQEDGEGDDLVPSFDLNL